MKFCCQCGKELVDQAIVCPYCGCAASTIHSEPDVPSIGLNILAFLFPLIGLILYCVYNEKAPNKAKGIGKWALTGFVTGIVLTGLFYGIGLSVIL